MSAAKRPKLSEPAYDPPMSEILASTDDFICRYNQPPSGTIATWREIDVSEDEAFDADSTSSEEEFDSTAHFQKLALEQYDRLIEEDPRNKKLIERRRVLLESIQASPPAEKMDVDKLN